MATVAWQVVETIWCDRIGREADLLEERIYPDDIVSGPGLTYQVRARQCSFGTECNLSGYPCRWAYNNPNYDPFLKP
jgi:hypothetical protein